MIPQTEHQLLWDVARRGAKIEVKINKVPGSVRLNSFVNRQGAIVDLKPCYRRGPFQIGHVVVRLFSIGFGRQNIRTFPVEHITLLTPLTQASKLMYHTPMTPVNDGPMTPLQNWQTPQMNEHPETPEVNYDDDACAYDDYPEGPEGYSDEE